MAQIAFACENEELRPLWVLILQQAGHHVREIRDFSAVKRILQHERFDLVVFNLRQDIPRAVSECALVKELYPDQRVAYFADPRTSLRTECADLVIHRDNPTEMLARIEDQLRSLLEP